MDGIFFSWIGSRKVGLHSSKYLIASRNYAQPRSSFIVRYVSTSTQFLNFTETEGVLIGLFNVISE